jgi:predicted nucleic acid-binding protein
VENAARLFERIDAGEIERFIAATTITNIYYIIRRVAGRVVAQDAVIHVLSDLNICTVDLEVLEQALASNFEDFEDAVQYACAVVHEVDAIVTRDAAGFANAEIPVVLPEDIDTIDRFG